MSSAVPASPTSACTSSPDVRSTGSTRRPAYRSPRSSRVLPARSTSLRLAFWSAVMTNMTPLNA
ncbi:hypothetical protein CMsap09_11195 [Clavibacter michiganensis]|uniref:Uncharacterized protein n=1 Tax=Clavibacter michiganensis TaxID=28447 RepID=A0A251XVL7_9MICO|nr:hypothetical protein CMsap09_11195 [Clavibacter michiganensis]